MPERQHPLRVFGGAGRCIACALLAVLPCADIARADGGADPGGDVARLRGRRHDDAELERRRQRAAR